MFHTSVMFSLAYMINYRATQTSSKLLLQARLTAALSEADTLVESNRKLIKEEANARTEAERARYEAAAAKATCEHTVQDRQLLEERLQVVQQRAKDSDAAHEDSAKQLRVRQAYVFYSLTTISPKVSAFLPLTVDLDNTEFLSCNMCLFKYGSAA